MSFVIESENPVVKAVVEGTAPRPARLAAARGILPLPDQDMLEVLVAFATSDDTELSGHARATLRGHDTEMLNGLVRNEGAPVQVLNYLASVAELPRKIHESIISNSRTPITTIVKVAGETRSPELLDTLSLNQQLLVQNPAIIDAILKNPNRSSEAERRAAETKQMRYFAGLTEVEIAEALGVTDRTIRRDWEQARLFLADALT
jgi:hypothetical protein